MFAKRKQKVKLRRRTIKKRGLARVGKCKKNMIPMRNRHTDLTCRGLHMLKKEVETRSRGPCFVDLTTKRIIQ
jgi:hypothetical protein